MDRRDFLKAGAALPLAGIPLGQGLAKEVDPVIGAKALDSLTPKEVGWLLTEYEKLIHYATWKIMRVYDMTGKYYVKGALIDPEKPLWGKMGEWTIYNFEGTQELQKKVRENLENRLLYAAEFWKRNSDKLIGELRPFDGIGFKTYAKEVIWRSMKAMTAGAAAPDEEDDWPQYRCGLNPENLPVVRFERRGKKHPRIENGKEIFEGCPWHISPFRKYLYEGMGVGFSGEKKTYAYVRKQDAIPIGNRLCWGKIRLILSNIGKIYLHPTPESYYFEGLGSWMAYNPELKYDET